MDLFCEGCGRKLVQKNSKKYICRQCKVEIIDNTAIGDKVA